jgi:hypothetical protein
MPFTVTSTFTGAGTGTWTYVDDVGAQVALLTAQVTALNGLVTANLTPAGIATPGTPVAIWSAQEDAMRGIWEMLEEINDRLEEMCVQQTAIEARLDTQTRGLANLAHHAAEQATTMQMAYIDQVKNNQFQQTTTNNALAAVGKPPTIVTPDDILNRIKKNIEDVSIVKAEQSATNMVFTYISETISNAVVTAETWWLSTALGSFIAESWITLKLKVKTLFGIQEAKKVTNKARRTFNSTKSGNPETI